MCSGQMCARINLHLRYFVWQEISIANPSEHTVHVAIYGGGSIMLWKLVRVHGNIDGANP